jgi:hypothetical protein
MMVTRGIADIESANAFLANTFLPWFNKKCTKEPMHDMDCHRTVEGYDLDAILCPKELRTVRNDYTFQHDLVKYQIEAGDRKPQMLRKKVKLELRLDGNIKCKFNDKYIHFFPVQNLKVTK